MTDHTDERRIAAAADPETDAPGLPARRLAAMLIDEVLKARLALDETFERLVPDFKLDAADAGLARAIAITAFRRLGTIQHAINARLERGSPRNSGPFEPILLDKDDWDHVSHTVGPERTALLRTYALHPLDRDPLLIG